MLRFLSRRKGRGTGATSSDTNNTNSQIKAQRIVTNKNLIPCRIILLDGTDLSIDLTVSSHREIESTLTFEQLKFNYAYHKTICKCKKKPR